MLEMDKISSDIMVTPINNGHTKLKINFTLFYFSKLKNIFKFILVLFEGPNIVKPQFLAVPNMHVKY